MASSKPFITFPRVAALFACGIFALVGSVVFFGHSLRGDWTPPPQVHQARADLEQTGVTTQAEPLFEIPASDEVLAIDGRMTHTQIESGERADVAAAIGVRAMSSNSDTRRDPIHAILVFDVSGSMGGDPLWNVQRAAVGFLDRLEENDRVGVVAYSSDARVVAPLTSVSAANRARLTEQINSLEAHGGTNIHAGWDLAKRELDKASSRAIRRVVLLSDGQANEGITDIDELGRLSSLSMESGTTTTTMGVGLDYNEDLMQRMARSGGGNYYFVAGAEPAAAFDEEFARLTGTISSRTRLRVQMQPAREVRQVEGYEWRPIPGGAEIELGALGEGMRRDVLVEFENAPNLGPLDVTAEVVWTSGQSAVHEQVWKEEIPVASENAFNAEVLSRLQKVKTARALHDATLIYQAGDRDEAARRLEAMVDENKRFVDEHDVEEEVFERANDKLGQLAGDIRDYDPASSRGKYMIKGSKFKSANVAVDSSVTF